MTNRNITLILGGARSGKSRKAEALALAGGGQAIYMATAQAFDEEMQERIVCHQASRDALFKTIEVPIHLADMLHREGSNDITILVDCLTLWLSNILLLGSDVEKEIAILLRTIEQCTARLIFVSNEVGLGIVPDNSLARQFRDFQGTLNQSIAEQAHHVIFMAAGLPIILK